eukprot:jgi/Psemu1/40357/gm1.40357_g
MKLVITTNNLKVRNETNDKLCSALIQGKLQKWHKFLDALLERNFPPELTYSDGNSGLQVNVSRSIQQTIEALADYALHQQETKILWQQVTLYSYDDYRNERAKRLQHKDILNPPAAPGTAGSKVKKSKQLQYESWCRKSHDKTSFTALNNDSQFEHWLIGFKAKLEAHDIDTETFLDPTWSPSTLSGFKHDLFVKQCAFFWVLMLQVFKSDPSSSCVLSHSSKGDGRKAYFDFIILQRKSKFKVYDMFTQLQTLLNLTLHQWKESKVKPLEYHTVKSALCQSCFISFQLSEQFAKVTDPVDSNDVSIYIQAEANAIHALKITPLLEATHLDSQTQLSVPKSTVRAHTHNISIKDSIPTNYNHDNYLIPINFVGDYQDYAVFKAGRIPASENCFAGFELTYCAQILCVHLTPQYFLGTVKFATFVLGYT